MKKSLTQNDIREAFIHATTNTSGARDRWKERAQTGLTEAQLTEALRYELGIWGGSSSTETCPDVQFQSAGFKIWASWESMNYYNVPPVLQGQQTINMARTVFGIKDPSDKQISLF